MLPPEPGPLLCRRQCRVLRHGRPRSRLKLLRRSHELFVLAFPRTLLMHLRLQAYRPPLSVMSHTLGPNVRSPHPPMFIDLKNNKGLKRMRQARWKNLSAGHLSVLPTTTPKPGRHIHIPLGLKTVNIDDPPTRATTVYHTTPNSIDQHTGRRRTLGLAVPQPLILSSVIDTRKAVEAMLIQVQAARLALREGSEVAD